ncbi:lipoprotein NlpI, partial [Vibrio parahaemolyticus]
MLNSICLRVRDYRTLPRVLLALIFFVIIGCSSKDWRKNEVFAVPLQPSLQQEVIL